LKSDLRTGALDLAVDEMSDFLWPVFLAVANGTRLDANWPPPGPLR
jgi:hypothetical protein